MKSEKEKKWNLGRAADEQGLPTSNQKLCVFASTELIH